MSQVSTAKASYKAKDGLWYPCYADMCEANKQFNQRHLEKLGLGGASPFSRQFRKSENESKRKLAKLNAAAIVTPEQQQQPTRRSLRARKVPPPPLPADYDAEGRPAKQPRRVVASHQQMQQMQLTDEDRQKLQNLPDWFDEMHQFLLQVPHGRGMQRSVCSNDNARSVMRQVQRLVAGVGITYQHWPQGVAFLPDTPVTLQWDLDDLYNQAVDFENEHGRDKGNGWLLRHPIRKMGFFQQYKLEQLNEQEEESEEQGGEEKDKKEEEKDKKEEGKNGDKKGEPKSESA